MKLELRKRKNNALRKLVKVNEEGNNLSVEPVYVRLEEAEGNVLQEGTALTPDIIEKINWRDETSVEFIPLSSSVLPSAKEGIIQIVCQVNGEIWCIPPMGVKEAFPLGNIDLDDFIKKYETNYLKNKSFEFFNLNKETKVFGTRTRIGAIPSREQDGIIQERKEFNDGTYMDINNTGKIVMYVQGEKKHEFTNEKVILSHRNSTIGIDGGGVIKLSAPGTSANIKLEGAAFSISSPKTKVEEANDLTKFNCFTNLGQASYGNQNFRLQFYSDCVRIHDPINSRNLIQFLPDGTIYQKGNLKVIDESSINSYIKDYLDSSLNNYIYNYLDNHFENEYYYTYLKKYGKKTALFVGLEQSLIYNLADNSTVYQIEFSEYANSTQRYSIIFKGTEIDTDEAVYVDAWNNSYKVKQIRAEDEQYDDYIKVEKYGASGTYQGTMYIYSLYYLG